MQIARFALVLISMAGAITIPTAIGCSGASSGTTTAKNPTEPNDDGDDGKEEPPATDAGGMTKDSGPRHDGGSTEAGATTTATCSTNGAKALSIDPNHSAPHGLADLPVADFAETSADDKQYTLTPGGGGGGGGSGQHTHTIVLTSAERAKLRRGETVARTSSGGGNNSHTHTVTLGCK